MDRCVQCHDRLGHPQKKPPPGVRPPQGDLSDPAFQAALTDADLRIRVRHGRSTMPGLVPRITDAEASALVRYVRILSPGYELYSRHCEQCHGRRGDGVRGVIAEAGAARFAFDATYFQERTADRTRRAVWHMLNEAKPVMPHFSYLLTPGQVEAILAYLRSLPSESGSPASGRTR
jgi:mono/diheme cytochrome c family protein